MLIADVKSFIKMGTEWSGWVGDRQGSYADAEETNPRPRWSEASPWRGPLQQRPWLPPRHQEGQELGQDRWSGQEKNPCEVRRGASVSKTVFFANDSLKGGWKATYLRSANICIFGGSITVPLTRLTGLDYTVLQIKTKIVNFHTADSKPNRRSMVQWYFPL